jgi:peptidoglycan biosynthesis protein MviN/MurJ (putative lipid II flippase)
MVASSPPVVVRVISPGPGLMTLLVTFLVGAATALVVQLVIQLYVVPRVETRKRRKDRWERDVRELGELLTTSVGSRAQTSQELKCQAASEIDSACCGQAVASS